MLRTTFIMVFTVVDTIFFCIMTIVFSFLDKTGNVPHRVARCWGASLLWAAGIRVRRTGLANIDPRKSYIFMPNHQSNFDIPVLLAHLPVQFRWLAKAELFTIPVFGLAMKRAGYISIDRSDFRSAVKSLKRAADAIRKGTSVVIFPEGTRSTDGSLGSFKKGGFVTAIESQVPIVPVIIHGTRAIMPKNHLRIEPNEVLLEVKRPVETKDFSKRQKQELMELIRSRIQESFEKSTARA